MIQARVIQTTWLFILIRLEIILGVNTWAQILTVQACRREHSIRAYGMIWKSLLLYEVENFFRSCVGQDNLFRVLQGCPPPCVHED